MSTIVYTAYNTNPRGLSIGKRGFPVPYFVE